MSVLKKGSSGDEVAELQERLAGLGFDIEADGKFGDATYFAVITLQTIFGYDIDGIVGPAMEELIEAQAGYGWNLQAARKAFVTPGEDDGEGDDGDEDGDDDGDDHNA